MFNQNRNEEQITVLHKLNSIAQQLDQQSKNQKEILSLEETASFLDCSKSVVYNYVRDRLIPYFKPSNRKIYFKKTDLIKWIETGRRSSIDEIQSDSFNYLKKK